MDEEWRQEVRYRGAFGTDGPVLRSVRGADENSISFSAILLKRGVQRGMNDEERLRTQRDFQVMTRRGDKRYTSQGCNWNSIRVSSTLEDVTLNADISAPGWVR